MPPFGNRNGEEEQRVDSGCGVRRAKRLAGTEGRALNRRLLMSEVILSRRAQSPVHNEARGERVFIGPIVGS